MIVCLYLCISLHFQALNTQLCGSKKYVYHTWWNHIPYDLELSWWLNFVNVSWASSHIRYVKLKWTSVLRREMVLRLLVHSQFSHLTWLLARESFIHMLVSLLTDISHILNRHTYPLLHVGWSDSGRTTASHTLQPVSKRYADIFLLCQFGTQREDMALTAVLHNFRYLSVIWNQCQLT
jgi:hypothetical protein